MHRGLRGRGVRDAAHGRGSGPADARATLRRKTLLGEAYIELTPGTAGARKLRIFQDDAYLSMDLQQKVLTIVRKPPAGSDAPLDSAERRAGPQRLPPPALRHGRRRTGEPRSRAH